MSLPLTLYVGPAATGTGDGSSLANRCTVTTLLTLLPQWRAELDADPADVGLNEAHTIKSVAPGFEPDYGDKSYVTATKYGVYVRRVCFVSDAGDYAVAGQSTTALYNLTPTMGPAISTDPTVGQSSGKPVRRFHFVALRSSDGVRADQLAGGTITRSKVLPKKDPAATWTLPANYTTVQSLYSKWSGATTTATYTWTVNLPSPIRARFVGERTDDPRTGDKHVQQWCASDSSTNQYVLADPTSSAVEPALLDGSGNRQLMVQGDVYDPAAGITHHTWVGAGRPVFFNTASCIAWQGFEFSRVETFTRNVGVATCRWQSYLDFRLDNMRYAIYRGDNRYDTEIARWQANAVAQKMLSPGQNCQRWHMSDVYSDGQLTMGDSFQTLMGASNGPTGTEAAWNAGAWRWENVIAEYFWGANVSGGTYINGDGIDAELRGFAVRNMYVDLTPDGGIDCKPTPYWVNWPAVAIFNTHLARNKRCFRSWPSVQNKYAVAPHVLRDVTLSDARQYGLFMVANTGHHKYVNWHNPDGRANWTNPLGRTFWAVSNDNSSGAGDMDAVIFQPFDARTGAAQFAQGMTTTTIRGIDKPPYRNKVWTPLTVPTALTVAVNGSTADDGTALAVLSGSSVTISPSGLPVGSQVTYTLSGPGTITPAGTDATVVPSVT